MQRSRALSRLGIFAACFALVLAACSEEEPKGVLQDLDLQQEPGSDIVFDKNNIVDPASFIDVDGIDAALVQKFLKRTPYARSSFLETYQSNGVRASDAIMNAARTYRINPLVFLVYAQTAEGLLGEINYPFPPERVEYVFRCGCLDAETCLPQLAGFDRQVDCLGRAFRKALTDIAEKGATAAGWGPDRPGTTLDGQKVTPASDVTAALYNQTPRVAPNEAGGTWLFWNVWNLYAVKMDYVGPLGGAGAGQWIGGPCVAPESCGFDNPICATNYPGGMCTTACDGSCPSAADRDEAFCADFEAEGGFCLQVCNPGAPECRPGYKCLSVARYNGTASDSKHVCYPDGVAP
jgi:hypothetical protein